MANTESRWASRERQRPVPPKDDLNDNSNTPDKRLQFFEKFERLLNSPDFSDLTIHCSDSDTSFYAHVCILGLHFDFDWDAIYFSEDPTKTISLLDHSAATVWRFLSWCYTGAYPGALPPTLPYPDMHTGVLAHIKLYFLAEELRISDLMLTAATNCVSEFVKNWNSKQFLEGLREVYNSERTHWGDNLLQIVFLRTAGAFHAKLKEVPEYLDVLMEVDGFAADLAWGHL